MSKAQTSVIAENACTFRGVVLDKLTERGPRGGKAIYWRAASKREYQVSSWSRTREDAAKAAPGYTG